MDAIELYRLREMVEAAFVNVLLALAIIPMETIAGLEAAIRVAGAVAIVYLIGHGLLLERRRRQAGIATVGSRLGVVLVIGLPAVGMAAAAAATGAVWALEILLLLLLARPMAAFLLVLVTFGTPARD